MSATAAGSASAAGAERVVKGRRAAMARAVTFMMGKGLGELWCTMWELMIDWLGSSDDRSVW